jgi:cytochrome b
MIRVWDIATRLFHWSLVTLVTSAWLLAEERQIHRWLGYGVGALILFRLIWGFVGPRHARFSDFIPSPLGLLRYLRDIVAGTEKRTLGHNPAGAAMIVALLVTLTGIVATGYMMGMDRYFGQEWVEEWHETLVDGLLVLVAFHVGGVLLASFRHHENLVKAMINGDKRADDKIGHD